MTAVPQIFDNHRRLLRRHRAESRQARPDAANWLHDAMAEDMVERIGFLRWQGNSARLAGLGSATIAAALGLPPPAATTDYERPFDGAPVDLIVSLGELDTINDLPGALIHLRAALAPGGLFLASVLGAGSIPKLRQAMLAADDDRPAAHIHPQIDDRAASALLQRAGFARQVVDRHTLTVRYATLDRLVADLRDHGQSAVLTDRAPPLGKAALERARAAFGALAEDDGKVSEKFEVITLTAWKS